MELINILNIFSQKKKKVNVVLSVLFFCSFACFSYMLFFPQPCTIVKNGDGSMDFSSGLTFL